MQLLSAVPIQSPLRLGDLWSQQKDIFHEILYTIVIVIDWNTIHDWSILQILGGES